MPARSRSGPLRRGSGPDGRGDPAWDVRPGRRGAPVAAAAAAEPQPSDAVPLGAGAPTPAWPTRAAQPRGQACFAGDHDACDQLHLQSVPFSEYERYGSTCGGRVEPLTVASCTELE